MKLFSTLPDKITAKISAGTGLEPAGDHTGQDTITIIIRKTKSGGVDDPTGLIAHPRNCIVIAGAPDETGQVFSEAAEQAGVPAENIYLIPAGQGLSLKILIDKVIELQQRLTAEEPVTTEDEDIFFLDDDDKEPNPPIAPPRIRDKVIAVRGYRGGVGATTIATSLAAHLYDNGGKVAVLDLGIPLNVRYHCEKHELGKKDGFRMAACEIWDLYLPPGPTWKLEPDNLAALMEILRQEYRWVVVDFSPQPDHNHIAAIKADKTIVVMDSDIVQSVEPVKSRENQVLIYNKVIPDITTEIIQDILGRNVIPIAVDYEGCYAALSAGLPANRKSEDVAVAIGMVAAKIS